jgi:type II secretory pathway pseudopilin PulG
MKRSPLARLVIAGMTLTEVVVATALAALSIGGIMGVVVQGMDLGNRADYAYAAANIAKNRIERVREIRKEQGYTSLSAMAEDDVTVDRDGIADSNGDFIRTTTVDSAYAVNLTKVVVKVKYKIRGVPAPVWVELTTLVSPYT